ncbi:MAG: Txe/YoeB family addiction module toxin [Fibromonadaceae bacterium]|nr:Txe/YoeB family addiction module toxin [Fibromonadaceae bacterium]
MSYKILYTNQAAKDSEKIKKSYLYEKAKEYIALIKENPYKKPPPYEKLQGDLNGAYSRRLNVQHRLVYEVLEQEKIIKILAMWGHYE